MLTHIALVKFHVPINNTRGEKCVVLLIAPTPRRGLRARIVSVHPKIIVIKSEVHGGHTSAREYMVGTSIVSRAS